MTKNSIQIGIIIVLGLALLLPGTATLPLVDRDEPRFAQATVEMIERPDWIVPYFNGEYRFDKPVLTYWLMRIGYALFGVSELGARMHSIVCTILIALVVFWAGRRWFSDAVGFGAAFGLLTSLQFILNGRSCIADMPMVLAVAVAQICLFELLAGNGETKHTGWMLTLYIALGLGFLTKGPIAILVPALSTILFRFLFWRKPLPWKNLQLHFGIPIVVIIVAAWGIPALLKTQGLFWDVGMGKHVVKRGVEIFNARRYIPVFYLITIFLSLFPWIAFAGKGWYVLRRRWEKKNAFLLSWFVAPYLIFTFYATQLPHYVMPGFAAFFLIMAQILEMQIEAKTWTKHWFRIVLAVPIVVICALLLWLLMVPFQTAVADLRWILWGIIGILSGLTTMAIIFHFGGKRWMWVAVVIIGVGLMSLGTGMRRVSPAVQLVPLFKVMPAETAYMGYRFTEGTLVFYSNRRWVMTGNLDKTRRFFSQSGPRMVVCLKTEKKLDRYLKWQWQKWRGQSIPMKTRDYSDKIDTFDTAGYRFKEIQGLNLGRFTWVTLAVYYRVT